VRRSCDRVHAKLQRVLHRTRAAGLRIAIALALSACADPAPPRPNVVFVLADDLGYGDIGVYHEDQTGRPPVVPTPNLDSLARAGMRFRDAHSPAAVCAPSRFSALTGSNPQRSRIWGTWRATQESALIQRWRHRSVGELLQRAGYRTAFLGKLHLGGDFRDQRGAVYRGRDLSQLDLEQPFAHGPREHGFDYSFVSPDGIQGPLYAWFENDRWAPLSEAARGLHGARFAERSRLESLGAGHPAARAGPLVRGAHGDSNWDPRIAGPLLARKAVAFVEDHAERFPDQPFLLYYASQALHWPTTPPAEFAPGVAVAGRSGLGARSDMLIELDLQVGAILDALERLGLARETLIFVTSDNGAWGFEAGAPQPGLRSEIEAGHDATGGLRGRKATIWEGGHRVPLIARWGDGSAAGSCIPPGRVSDELVSLNDWVATLYDLTGQEMEEMQAMDAASLVPLLLGSAAPALPLHPFLILQGGGASGGLVPKREIRSRAIRAGSWVLTLDGEGETSGLYDLASDPRQERDRRLEPEQRERVRRLRALFAHHDGPRDARSTQRFEAARRTPLPARCRGSAAAG